MTNPTETALKYRKGTQRIINHNPDFIGIDPDVKKSGVAYYFKTTKQLELSCLTFFELFEYLQLCKTNNPDVKVYIEASWLIKTDWNRGGKNSTSTLINKSIGANHETGRKIVEMCEYLEISYVLVRPTTKKLTHEKFVQFTGIIGKTNQEMRDAAMLVYGR